MNKTIEIIRKKMAGTAIIALFVMGLALSTSSVVQALFINTKTDFIVDGVVASVGTNRVTIFTAGDPNVTIDTDSNTIFVPAGLLLGDLVSGDVISITAETRLGDTPLARLIEFVGNGPGYGTQGDSVLVTNAVVTNKTAETFTVNTGSAIVSFKVSLGTNFIYSGSILGFADLDIGNKVFVQGEDNTTEFIANTVIINSL